MKIQEYYLLIKLHPNEEEILYSNTNKERVEREKQEKEWSSIQNTGHSRHDLKIITFTRNEEVE